MSKPPEQSEIERLLARGRLSGPERERIFERAIATLPSSRSWWQRFAWYTWSPALAAVCVLAWFGLHPTHDGFRSRGVETAGAAIELGCATGAVGSCPQGETLVFRVDDARLGGYLVAWAERSADHRDKIWYFPTTRTAAPALLSRSGPQTIPEGIRIGPEQPPGRYEVHVRVLGRPIEAGNTAAAQSNEVLAEKVFVLDVTP